MFMVHCVGIFESFSSNVTAVIDHHERSAHSVAAGPGVTVTIERVGSCATLVARQVLSSDDYVVDELVATLLLSAILLDTGNLKAPGRVAESDESTVDDLVKFLPPSFSCDDHFDKLFRARFDTSHLTVGQALKKDYKQCKVGNYVIGFSTINALISDFFSRHPTPKQSILDFYSVHKLDALLILGISVVDLSANKIERQIAVCQPQGTNAEFSESIINMLEADAKLRCERMKTTVEFEGVLMEQGNASMSRKDIIPIITSFVSSV